MIAVVRCYAGADWAPDTIVVCGTPVQMIGAARRRVEGEFRLSRSAKRDRLRSDTSGDRASEPWRTAGRPQRRGSRLRIRPSRPGRSGGKRICLDRARTARPIPEAYTHRPKVPNDYTNSATAITERRRPIFRSRTGRIAAAFSLLRHTDQTVTEIAALLGYNDAAHFTRAFERWSGTSPRARAR